MTITGQFTHFSSGSVASFSGTGITAGTPTAATATSLTVPVSIAGNAPLGPQGIQVVTGPETVSLANAFTVTAGTPAITQVNPNTGQQGQSNLSVTISGNFTHFTTASVVTYSGTGITAGTPTAATATSLTVPVTIAAGAAAGAQGIQVVSGAETVSLANAFTVTNGTPAITLVSPNTGQQGQTNLAVTITGSFTHFTAASVVTFSGTGITAGTPTAATATSLTVPVTIASTAPLGTTGIRVVTGSETVLLGDALIVQQAMDLLVGDLGDNSIKRYDGVTGAFLGNLVTPGAGSLVAPNFFIVGPDARLYVSSHKTHSIKRYDSVTGVYVDDFVASNGGGLSFPYGLAFGPDGNLYVSSTINGTYTPGGQSPLGGGAIKRYNGTTGAYIDEFVPNGVDGPDYPQGLVFGPDGNLYVTDRDNPIRRYNGNTGAFIDNFATVGSGKDAVSLKFGPDHNLYVTEYYGHVVERYNGATGADMGSFVPFGAGGLNWDVDVAFGPDGDLYETERFQPAIKRFDGVTGAYVDDFVPTGGGGLGESFALLWVLHPTSAAPLISSVSPATGRQNQNMSVNITGQSTHFVQGTTTATFGAGITLTSLTVNSATSATAVLNIDPNAATGARNVTLTTGAEVVTLVNGFTVTAGTPVITLVSPSSGQQGQTNLSVTISGNFTHFGTGSVVTFSGMGIAAGTPTAATLTSLTLPLTIAADAALGAQGIQVVTGAETVSLANAFRTVSQLPVSDSSLTLWLDASNGLASNGALWTDLSGYSHNATPLSGQAPSLVQNALNGLPAAAFSGDQALSVSGQVLTSQQFTILSVVTDTSGPNGPQLRDIFSNWNVSNQFSSVFIGDVGPNGTRHPASVAARFTDALGGGNAPIPEDGVGIVTNPSQAFILSGESTSSDAIIWQNATQIANLGSAMPPWNLTAAYYVGRQGSGGGDVYGPEYWSGYIAEMLVYNRALTTQEVATTISYLTAKWLGSQAPVMLTSNPNQGQQGQQNLSVTITG